MLAKTFSRVHLLVPLSLTLAAGCVESASLSGNDDGPIFTPADAYAPTATILAPADGDAVLAGASVELHGRVVDGEDAAEDLQVTWKVGGKAVACDDATPDSAGETRCTATFTADDDTVELVVVDSDGQTSAASASVTVEAPDDATISFETSSDSQLYSDAPVSFRGVAVGVGELEVSFESSLDGDVFDVEVDEDGRFTAIATLSEGSHVVTATVVDEQGATANAATTITVGGENVAPTCAILGPTDDSRTLSGENTELRAIVDDANAGPDGVDMVWVSSIDGYLGGGDLDAQTGEVTLDLALSPGVHTLELIATDHRNARCTDTIEHTVGTPPSLSLTGPAELVDEGDALSFTAQVDGEMPESGGLLVVWHIDGTPVATTLTDEAGHATFETTASGFGQRALTASTADAFGWEAAAGFVYTVNGRPSVPEGQLPSSAKIGDDIEFTVMQAPKDPEGMPVSTLYQWFVDGEPYGGASGATFPSGVARVGQQVGLEVVASDGRINSEVGRYTTTIENSAPVGTFIGVSPGAPSSADTIQCDAAGFDPDGGLFTVEYQWSGVEVAGSASIPGGTVPGGTELKCTAVLKDEHGGLTRLSTTVAVGHSAPVVRDIQLQGDASTDGMLTASVVAEDYDGDAISFNYDWSVNGVVVGSHSETLSGSYFQRDDVVSVTVTPFDERQHGNPQTSAPVVIGNARPEAPPVSIEPLEPVEGDDLLCVIDGAGSDPDGDAITSEVVWLVDGERYDRATDTAEEPGDTIPGEEVKAGQRWACTFETSDGDLTSSGPFADVTIDAPRPTERFDIEPDDIFAATDTCGAGELLADGSLVLGEYDSGSDFVMIGVMPPVPSEPVTRLSATFDLAVCGAFAADTPLLAAVVDLEDADAALGATSVDLGDQTAPCVCADADEAQSVTLDVLLEEGFDPAVHSLVLSVDSDAFGVIPGPKQAVVIEYTY